MLSASYSSARPTGGLELWSWFFMRISGVVLLALALGHLVIMHLVHNVDVIDYAFVADRYNGWFWRGYDLAMLVLAMLHGLNGIRILLDDYIHPPRWHRVAVCSLYLVSGGFLLLGISVILFFKPAGIPLKL